MPAFPRAAGFEPQVALSHPCASSLMLAGIAPAHCDCHHKLGPARCTSDGRL